MRYFIGLLLYFLVSNIFGEVITGRISGEVGCKTEEPYLVILVNKKYPKIAMYQITVPEKGTFNFHVKKGEYQVDAYSKSGCRGTNIIPVKENTNLQSFDLKLIKNKK